VGKLERKGKMKEDESAKRFFKIRMRECVRIAYYERGEISIEGGGGSDRCFSLFFATGS
jgi:hypothetical protein